MKKLVLFSILFLSSLILTPSVQATCYYPTDPDYPACVGGITGSSSLCCAGGGNCPGLSNPVYACCTNTPGNDICPPLNPLTPTPTIDPNGACGHTGQFCCAGGTCFDPLLCVPTAAGTYCISQAQCNLLPGGCSPITPPSPDSKLWCNNQIGTVRTAIGCIQAGTGNPKDLFNQIISWSVGIGAGLSLISLIYDGFTITSAGGDSKKIAAAKQSIFSTITGLILIVLGVLIINFFAVSILNLNTIGFGV